MVNRGRHNVVNAVAKTKSFYGFANGGLSTKIMALEPVESEKEGAKVNKLGKIAWDRHGFNIMILTEYVNDFTADYVTKFIYL